MIAAENSNEIKLDWKYGVENTYYFSSYLHSLFHSKKNLLIRNP